MVQVKHKTERRHAKPDCFNGLLLFRQTTAAGAAAAGGAAAGGASSGVTAEDS